MKSIVVLFVAALVSFAVEANAQTDCLEIKAVTLRADLTLMCELESSTHETTQLECTVLEKKGFDVKPGLGVFVAGPDCRCNWMHKMSCDDQQRLCQLSKSQKILGVGACLWQQ
ncbi:MAG TPA: hypothetical protein VM432_00565 [Bdellovibrionales bacterium]|nr:hypothetical protein [Bdellovibrionales bacterium]